MRRVVVVLILLLGVTPCPGIQKNVASQKIQLVAWDTANGTFKTGDAANVTCCVNKGGAGAVALTDASAAEVDATNAPGVYEWDLAQAETNADQLSFSGKSTTADIIILPMLNVETLVKQTGDAYVPALAAQETLDDGTSGLAALKTLIDTVDGIVDAIWAELSGGVLDPDRR
jgi:hypothetical protein